VRNVKLTQDLELFFYGLRDRDNCARALEKAEPLMNRLGGENGLLEDLLVYVQNETLGAVFGTKAPFRRPTDERALRIVTGKHGHLEMRGESQ
jgi:hypothetical protein